MTVTERLKRNTESYLHFLFIRAISTLVLCFVLWGLYLLLLPGVELYFSSAVPVMTAATVITILLIVLTEISLALLAFGNGVFPKKYSAWLGIYLEKTLPLIYGVGRILGISKSQMMIYCVRFLNRITVMQRVQVPPDRLLLLTPHCLQHDTCPFKVTRDVNNCHQCGKCQVGDLLALSRTYGVPFLVVTGGTLARQMVAKVRPKAVIAIACERDLMSGMQDVFPVPVIGLLNERPFGPCFNTRIDVEAVEEMIVFFTKGVSPHECA